MKTEQFLWAEKYRPKTVKDCILPPELKDVFQGFVDQNNVPNLLLAGPSGTGKTTVARAMIDEIGADMLFIPASFNAGIDVLRNDIAQFASSVSFMNAGRKYVVLDEADYLNATVQPALRNFMDEFAKNAGFILTCNYPSRIMPELHSRCSVIDFHFTKKVKTDLAKQTFARVVSILQRENVKYQPEAVGVLVKKFFPDLRKIINELQKHAAKSGEINAATVADVHEVSLSMLIGYLRERDYTSARTWVGEHHDLDQNEFFLKLFHGLEKHLTPASLGMVDSILAVAQDRATRVQNPEINIAGTIAEIMATSEWK